jgi:hypothetical protein
VREGHTSIGPEQERPVEKESKAMIKSVGQGFVGFMVNVMQGVVSAGDRVIHMGSAVVANEFFLMVATIVFFVVLLKGF